MYKVDLVQPEKTKSLFSKHIQYEILHRGGPNGKSNGWIAFGFFSISYVCTTTRLTMILTTMSNRLSARSHPTIPHTPIINYKDANTTKVHPDLQHRSTSISNQLRKTAKTIKKVFSYSAFLHAMLIVLLLVTASRIFHSGGFRVSRRATQELRWQRDVPILVEQRAQVIDVAAARKSLAYDKKDVNSDIVKKVSGTNQNKLKRSSTKKSAVSLSFKKRSVRKEKSNIKQKQHALEISSDPVKQKQGSIRGMQGIVDAPRQDHRKDESMSHQEQTPRTRNNERAPSVYTEEGSMDIVDLSMRHIEPASNITAAVCYKTLFGNIDISLVLQWVAYNRLLGFDHIFLFYRPNVASLEYFDVLQRLPYVTLTVNTKGNKKDYYQQEKTDTMCLSQPNFAGNFDFAMVADIDEYLRFPKLPPGSGIKDFLQIQKAKNLTYLSFGKRMYTLDHRTDMEAINYKIETKRQNAPFVLSQYPFYMEYFCYGRRKGTPNCPSWMGRAKLIVNPKQHQHIKVHGIYFHTDNIPYAHHFHPSEAFFMEWPHIFSPHNVTHQQAAKAFTVVHEDEVHIHNMKEAFLPNKDGSYSVKYDANIQEWFLNVIRRARVTVESIA